MPTERLFHTTTPEAARAILDGGFRDGEGHYGMPTLDEPLRGVFVSNVAQYGGVDFGNEGADTVLSVDIDPAHLDGYEIESELDLDPDLPPPPANGGVTQREWCVPAPVLNEHGHVELRDEEEYRPF